MKHISLLLVIILAGCAVSTDQLHTEAMGCGNEEQCKPFWDAYNKRLETITKREERLEKEQVGQCPRGKTKFCSRGRCGCVSDIEIREWLRRLGR